MSETLADRSITEDDVYINNASSIMEMFGWEKVSSEVVTPIRAPDGSYITIVTPRYHYTFTQHVLKRFNQPPNTSSGTGGGASYIVEDADDVAVFAVPAKRVVSFGGSTVTMDPTGGDQDLTPEHFQKNKRSWSTASSQITRDNVGVYTQQHTLTASTRMILDTDSQHKYTIPPLTEIKEAPEFT